MGNNKLFYIYSSKMLGIIFLIIGHCAPNTEIQRIIYSFHMPLFIFVHGYLNGYRHTIIDNVYQYIKYKTIKFLKLYALSSAFLIQYGIVCVLFNVNCFYMRSIVSITQCIYDTIVFYGIGTLWFLPVVYFLDVIYALFRKNKLFVILLYLASVLLFLYFNKHRTDLLNNNFKVLLVLIRILISIPFYYLGIYINYLMHSDFIKRFNIIIMCGLFSIWFVNVVVCKSVKIDMYTLCLPDLLQFNINAMCASVFIFLFCYNLLNRDLFVNKFIGGGSFLYMLFNNLSLNSAISKLAYIFFAYRSYFIDCVSTFVITSFLAYFFIKNKLLSEIFSLNKIID